ncbi:sporulation protein YunB [Tepidimicrobium xylanilyticum]|uniref:Sporulation protein YunB n=1 Tax=Tepidimicrobium xylanilyticum TaxID=1123352 RepID=A0A1H2STZ6_9FIRM|nr:sporulation protein YunB [Tepidimicrobium xylanilyticum]GMG96116.1 sporulation protein YunB [Tepidimicrobium xylanilyticum]SDW35131.1 sporulation protein YunB [Tepidimicrobium xylanilyticum]
MKYYISKIRRKRLILWIITILLIILYIYKFIDKKIVPTVKAVAEIKARSVTTETINDTIKNKIRRDIEYSDLIFVKYDNEGKVTLMQANTILMNSIASEVALEVQKQLKNISESTIKVPLSNAFDTQLINLPSVKIRIIPQGSVSVDFATEFESTGINQTRHRIYIIVVTDIRMIVPLESENLRITTNIPIAETIIVGDVPNQYVNIPEDELLNIVD